MALVDMESIRSRVAAMHAAWRKLARPADPKGGAQRSPALRAEWEAWKAWHTMRTATEQSLALALPGLPDWQTRYAAAYKAAKAAGIKPSAPTPKALAATIEFRADEGASAGGEWFKDLASNVAIALTTAGVVAIVLAGFGAFKGRR